MAFILKKVLCLKPEEVKQWPIPYICDVNDIERLKRIICTALTYLKKKRSEIEIMAAWEDAINLYSWFFDNQRQQIRLEIEKQLQSDILKTSSYMDVDSYIENTVEALELLYLSEVDVLNAILQLPNINSLAEIECVNTNFSDAEFFCVLALYQSSIAIQELENTRTLLDSSQTITEAMLKGVKNAGNAILEAQVAIDYAQMQDEFIIAELSNLTQYWIHDHHKELVQKAHHVRYGDKHQKRREKAWQLFQQLRPNHTSDFNAVAEMINEIQAYSEEIGLAKLKYGSEVETVARWIRRIKAEQQDKK